MSKFIKSLLPFVYCFLLFTPLWAQIDTVWVKRYDGVSNASDQTTGIAIDNRGNVYVCGYSTGSGVNANYITVKYDSMGIQQWLVQYNGPGNGDDYAHAIVVDNGGNVYVTGESEGSNTSKDYATVKYDSSGIEKWVKRYDGPPGYREDRAYGITIDNESNICITGESYGTSSGLDYATIKYDSLGVQQWVMRYENDGNDQALAITIDDLDNIYITGMSDSTGTVRDYLTIKYNTSGVTQWVARYNGPGSTFDDAQAIAVDNSSNVYVTGGSCGLGTNYDYCTIKYSSTGIEQWVARYNWTGNDVDIANAISLDGSGNVYVTGGSRDANSYYDFATIKYDTLGIEQWVTRYDGPGNGYDVAQTIVTDGLKNIYVSGASVGLGSGADYATIKYDSLGITQWTARYNGDGNGQDEAKAMAIDSSGYIYVTGYSTGLNTSWDFATIKYNPLGSEQWIVNYNGQGSGSDCSSAIVIDQSGNVYVTGVSEEDYATIKYTSSGIEQWVKKYNGPGNDYDTPTSIAIDNYGNVYVTGYSISSNGDRDYATIKYDSLGNEQWVSRYNGPGNGDDYARVITIDNLDNIYVTGTSYGTGTGNDYATIKYNSSGVVQWLVRYNSLVNGADEANALAVDDSGNVYVTGKSDSTGTGSDYLTIKYNSSGVEQWIHRYNGPYHFDKANAIAVDNSGNVYVTGESDGIGSETDYATIKYNAYGVEQWVRRYDGPTSSYDRAQAITVDGSGNVYLTGYSRSSTGYDYATIKYNSSGIVQFIDRYNGQGNGDDYAISIAIDDSGNTYVAGYSQAFNTLKDYAIVKYDYFGAEEWCIRYNGPSDSTDIASAFVLDSLGNIYITGCSYGINTLTDYATIKYSQSLGITEGPKNPAVQYAFLINNPNPFKEQTNIQYSIPTSGWVSLSIYDISGRMVKTLFNAYQKQKLHNLDWYGEDNYGNKVGLGIYFAILEFNGQVQRKKMLLIK